MNLFWGEGGQGRALHRYSAIRPPFKCLPPPNETPHPSLAGSFYGGAGTFFGGGWVFHGPAFYRGWQERVLQGEGVTVSGVFMRETGA